MREQRLSIKPYISYFSKVFTDAECDFVIENSEKPNRFYKSGVYSAPGKSIVDPNIRTSSSYFDEENIFENIRNKSFEIVKDKFSHVDNFSIDHFEKCEIQRYYPSEYVRNHVDYFARQGQSQNDRMATFLIYLNDDFEGGKTYFNNLNIEVKPERGSALFFTYPKEDVEKELNGAPLTLHEGTPVVSGVKYVITQWIRNKPIQKGSRY